MRLPHHLYRHPLGAFYFVLAVPKSLQDQFRAKRIRYSLKTREPLQARLEAYRHTTIWQQRFSDVAEPKVADILNSHAEGSTSNFEIGVAKGGKPYVKSATSKEDHALALEEIGRIEEGGLVLESPKARVVVRRERMSVIPDTRKTMQEAVKDYVAGLEGALLPKTLSIKTTALVEFKLFIKPKTMLHRITKADLYQYKLQALQSREHRTVYNKFIYLAQFFDEMIKAGYYTLDNPAKGQIKYSGRQKARDTDTNKYLPFSTDELETIFNPKHYPTNKPHMFWGLMLGYYTGMRVNEVCQLFRTNIDRSTNTIKISVGGKEQSVKSSNAKRVIPIHPDILDAGFYKYLDDLVALRQFHLFPNLMKTMNNYGGRLSSDFSRYLASLRIKEERKSFHSLRNTFAEMLDQQKVDIVSSSYFMGHRIDSMMLQHYLLKNPHITSPESMRELCFPAFTFRISKAIRYEPQMFNDLLQGKIAAKEAEAARLVAQAKKDALRERKETPSKTPR